ncbi:MAG: T9SS type A sorting domain-containing protein [Patiriisocius sp.]|uniref:T9SS type A sorting domain-containing protein n=1 Tax=Patiriisocius sp. TaxID=2822396 RepID=UPI003EF23178
MKKFKILCICLIITSFVNAQDVAWLNTIGSEDYETVRVIKTDSENNVYVLGEFNGTVDFDPGNDVFNLTSNGFNDIYVQKLDSEGALVWAIAIGAETDLDYARDFAVTDEGKIYIVGEFSDTLDLDPGTDEFIVETEGQEDGFIIALNDNGSFSNGFSFGGESFDYLNGVEIAQNGNVILTGSFFGLVDFDPGTGVVNLNSANGNAFVLTVTPSLQFVHVFSYGGSGAGSVIPLNVLEDTNNNIIITGTFSGTVDFDPTNGVEELTSTGGTNYFVAKYTNAQQLVWAKGFGNGDVDQRLRESSLDSNNNILLTGGFGGTMDVNPNAGIFEITSQGNSDIFIVKLTEAGGLSWAKAIGSDDFDPDEGFSITTNSQDDVIVSGKFLKTVDFDPGAGIYELTSNGGKEIFVLQLNNEGEFKAAYSMGGPDRDTGAAAAIDANDAIIIGGTFRDTADLQPGIGVNNITSNGNADAFVIKLNNLTLSIGDNTISASEIVAYPNPTTGIVNLRVPNTNSAIKVTICNMLDQVVFEQKFQQEENVLFKLPEANGLYLCNISVGNTSQTIKLIKE